MSAPFWPGQLAKQAYVAAPHNLLSRDTDADTFRALAVPIEALQLRNNAVQGGGAESSTQGLVVPGALAQGVIRGESGRVCHYCTLLTY